MTDETTAGHVHPNYMAIFWCLVILTAASFLTVPLRSVFPPDMKTSLIILWVIGIAVGKATLVAMFFMHLKFEGRWKYVLIVPPLCMGIVLFLALVPDIAIGM